MNADPRYKLTAVLSCGCEFGHNWRGLWNPGEYVGCPKHSPLVGYDPDDGDPIYERDQTVVRVEEAKR